MGHHRKVRSAQSEMGPNNLTDVPPRTLLTNLRDQRGTTFDKLSRSSAWLLFLRQRGQVVCARGPRRSMTRDQRGDGFTLEVLLHELALEVSVDLPRRIALGFA
jgi:hypothetical protein